MVRANGLIIANWPPRYPIRRSELCAGATNFFSCSMGRWAFRRRRSEEHTSELQSQSNLVCRLLLEKKKNPNISDPDDGTANSMLNFDPTHIKRTLPTGLIYTHV